SLAVCFGTTGASPSASSTACAESAGRRCSRSSTCPTGQPQEQAKRTYSRRNVDARGAALRSATQLAMKDEPRCADTGEWCLFTRSKPLARSKAPVQVDLAAAECESGY